VSAADCNSLPMRLAPLGKRLLKFNLVGALGTVVQLGALVLLKSGLHINYLWATALAVELSVLHNFAWHERYTWSDRFRNGWRTRLRSVAAFHLTNGFVSVIGNVFLMRVFVGRLHMQYFIANVAAILNCGVLNFVLADRVAFGSAADQRG